jgi:hypothetical protein
MAKPVGSGARFAALKKTLAARGATDPGALAAWIGSRKYGPARMSAMSAAGRRKASKG